MDWLFFVLGTFCFALFPFPSSHQDMGEDSMESIIIKTETNDLDNANASILVPDKGYTASVVLEKIESLVNGSVTYKQDSVSLNDNIRVQTGTHGLERGNALIRVPGKGYTASVRIEKIIVDPINVTWHSSLPRNDFIQNNTGSNGSPMGETSPSGFVDNPTASRSNKIGPDVKIVSESIVSKGNEINVVIAKVTRNSRTRRPKSLHFTRPIVRITFQAVPRFTVSWENDNGYARSNDALKPKSDDDELTI